MKELIFAFSFFILFAVMHAILYRLKVMKFQPLFFILITWGGLLALTFCFKQNGDFTSADKLPFTSIALYLLLCHAYIAQTTAVENDSPSMKIIRCIKKNPAGHSSFEEIKGIFSDQEFVYDRLHDLVQNGHVSFDGIQYALTSRGQWIASIVAGYRQLIRRGIGG